MNDEQSVRTNAANKSWAASNQSLRIRKYEIGDEREILRLRRMIFGPYDLDRWTWEFIDSPSGSLMLVAESGNRVVGFYSYLLVAMKVGSRSVKGAIACEVMVHPKFRRRGLWHEMARMLWEEAKRQEVVIQYSFPSNVAHKHRPKEITSLGNIPILVKFFDTHEEIRKRVRSEFLARILRFFANAIFKTFLVEAKKCPSIQNFVLNEIFEFDNRFNSFWEKASTAFKIATIRDREYLNWRYFGRPGSNFRVFVAEERGLILGYIVLSVERTHNMRLGYIIDIMTLPDNPEVTQTLIAKAVEILEREKVSEIQCLMMKNNEYFKVFRKCGFIGIFGRRLVAQVNPLEVSEGFKDPVDWYLTFGDTDGIAI